MPQNISQTAAAPLHGQALREAVVHAVETAGKAMLQKFPAGTPPETMQQLRSTLEANDEASLAILRPLLMAARPGAQ